MARSKLQEEMTDLWYLYAQCMIHTGVIIRLDTCVSANNIALMTAIE